MEVARHAAKDVLQPGMILVEIQGQEIKGLTMKDAEAIFRSVGRPVRLAFASPQPQRQAAHYWLLGGDRGGGGGRGEEREMAPD